ncbi:MAG: DNA polymerase, partial [Nitrososphaera sp.]|nr:DNA polymerase [Nitrososphaera sp.]
WDKLLTTYVDGIEKRFQTLPSGDVIIPFRLGVMGARTGRRASDKPNAQNWPKSVRKIIRSRYANGAIAANDFSKLEVILLAFESGDEELLDIFTNSPNGYIEVGERLFKRTVKEGTPQYRLMKSVILGVNYNLQDYGLAMQLWDMLEVHLKPTFEEHQEEVSRVRKQYLRMFPRIVAYQKERIREVHEGNCLLWFGQKRRLYIPQPPARSEDKEAYKRWRKIAARAENQAINARIQNAASYVSGTAMLDVEEALLDRYNLSYSEYHRALAEGRSKELRMPLLINEVHDSLVFDMPRENQKRDLALIKDCMTQLRTLRKLKSEFDIKIKISQDVCKHWGEKLE